MDRETYTLSEFINKVETEVLHGLDLRIKAWGGACELTLLLPNDKTVSFSVINRKGKMMAWGLDKEDTDKKLEWAIRTYYQKESEMYKKLYERLLNSAEEKNT